jgi:hypothetical protein
MCVTRHGRELAVRDKPVTQLANLVGALPASA